MPAILAVRFKGRVDAKREEEYTLALLRLRRPMAATILPDTPSVRGMLRKVQHYVAWAPADPETVKLLLERRGEVSRSRRLSPEALRDSGYPDIDELARALAEGRVQLHRVGVVKPFFRLAPPRGGFRAKKGRLAEQGGIFGYNPRLPELVRRMV
jgi:large subunit ribosomal protein L30